MAISGTRSAGAEHSMDDCYVAVDLTPAASSYVDISTWGASVRTSGGEASTSRFHTFSGDPIAQVGKTGPRRVEVTCVFTDTSTDPFAQIFALSAGDLMDVQWSKSNTSGELEFTTSAGKFVHCTIPEADSNRGDVRTFRFIVEADSIGAAAITP